MIKINKTIVITPRCPFALPLTCLKFMLATAGGISPSMHAVEIFQNLTATASLNIV